MYKIIGIFSLPAGCIAPSCPRKCSQQGEIPGDYILWRTDYEDRSKETIITMSKKKGTKPTLDMLLETGNYATPQSQTALPKDVLEA